MDRLLNIVDELRFVGRVMSTNQISSQNLTRCEIKGDKECSVKIFYCNFVEFVPEMVKFTVLNRREDP